MPNNYDDIKEIPGYPKIPLGRAKDIRGQKFGRLTPLYRTNNISNKTAWLCKCECGNYHVAVANNLKTGSVHSCGCLGAESSKNNLKKAWKNIKAEDLTGQRFGRLIALYRTNNKSKQTTWHCICDCGNECDVYAAYLKNGHTQSCGCLHQEKSRSRYIDLTGKRFGRLVVLEKTNQRKSDNTIVWKCQCDCGNIVFASENSLQQGKKQSCGCLQKEKTSDKNFIDISNKKFGRLTALYPVNKGKCNGSISWFCQCDCGNTCIVSGYLLRHGYTKSCGCLRSNGETLITKILSENNIIFERQKTFDNCRFFDTNYKAVFDFFINNSYLLEYDGDIHFQEGIKGNGWNTQDAFEKRQQRDEYKNQWCKENNIPLIRIPYWHYNDLCLEDLLLETTQFRVA